MHRALSSGGSHCTIVLHGLGGIGKTQLIVAYVKRHKDNYSAIFWLNIKDEYSLRQSFANIARQILREHPLASQLSSVDTKGNLDKVIYAVKAWLSLPKNTQWLMIYDNYNNSKLPGNTDSTTVDIYKFLPESYQGSVIITTRSSQVRIDHSIRIRKLENVDNSLKILSSTSRREGLINDTNLLHL
jgi:GTPase SAR1 family protein